MNSLMIVPVFTVWWEVEWAVVNWPLGISLVAAGTALRLWSISYLGRSARTRKDKARRLVTTGPFSLCRNPIYMANMVGACGFIVLCEVLWCVPIYVVYTFCIYSLIARYEEYLLSCRFQAEYTAYVERTPRWIPRPSAFRLGTPEHGFREILYRERSVFYMLCAGLLVVVSKEMITHVLL